LISFRENNGEQNEPYICRIVVIGLQPLLGGSSSGAFKTRHRKAYLQTNTHTHTKLKRFVNILTNHRDQIISMC
jgi:hypothetical protein